MRHAITTFLLVASSAALLAAATPQKPNIVFILADDLGWADTTLYGHTKLYQTPNLERLSKRGITFTRAYSSSPLCSPTRSAVLTGLSPARTGITITQIEGIGIDEVAEEAERLHTLLLVKTQYWLTLRCWR